MHNAFVFSVEYISWPFSDLRSRLVQSLLKGRWLNWKRPSMTLRVSSLLTELFVTNTSAGI